MNNLSSPSNPMTQHHPSDDEIDLWQLIETLWQGKYWITGITIFFMALGFGYTLQASEEWQAQASVIAPDYAEYQQVANFSQQLQPAFGVDFSERIKAINFNNSEAVFKRFITLFNSTDNKLAFLQTHPAVLQHLKQNQIVEEGKALNDLAKNISASTKVKERTDEFGLIFTSWNAASSQELLTDYTSFTSEKVTKELQDNLTSLANLRKNELQQSFSTLESNAKAHIARELELLNHSLMIASAANIQAPIADPGTEDQFAINLGAKAIEAKITELKSLKNLAIIEPTILTTQNQLMALDKIDLSIKPSFNAYKFIETPTEPLSRESPKKALIMLTSVLVGGVLGSIYVLIAQAVRFHRKELAS